MARPSARRVKRYWNYTVDEAARVTGVARGTVRRWLKNGLPAITDQKPLLILGADLIDRMKARQGMKQKCLLHECYCFSCRTPRPPAFGEVEFFPLAPTSGNMRALCNACGNIMHKRVATAKLDPLRALVDVTIRQGIGDISDNPKPCFNDHLPKEG
jgi:hypothetical protein